MGLGSRKSIMCVWIGLASAGFHSSVPSAPALSPPVDFISSSRSARSTLKDVISQRKWTLTTIQVEASSLRMLLLPVILHLNWIIFTPIIFSDPPRSPFEPLLFISHPTPSPSGDPNDPRYRRGWLDFVFVAYYIIFFSFVRQVITIKLCRSIARRYGLRKESKLARFGEQGYAMIYFACFGAWGLRIMSQLPTWWYKTEYFWIDYPHWQMKPELKRYYLMQAAYWCQQLIVLAFKLEKPRNDYRELVAHHIVTLWLVGWSYGLHLTLIGNAVYMSMDIPDTFLALSKLLNYMGYDSVKTLMFIFFLSIWTYFRHYLNIVILWSVWKEFDLIPAAAKYFRPLDDIWMAWWMKWQIFTPILLLQFLNLFWYYLILRVFVRAVKEFTVEDVRSDEDDSSDDDDNGKED
ncbi:hypothetical protein EW146_g1403 [Bondarzewia mesenterica]|uniref:TLC domain-containing protein n=1 Tax=Bondarzewia mesenterica TaxID=1095465 RepID=A0A4S4M4G5_9AGAM|nr:hypothetical protein EW146_g1403 [Bondarzewia mesenterica]